MMARRPMYRASFALPILCATTLRHRLPPRRWISDWPERNWRSSHFGLGWIAGLRRGFLDRGSNCFGRRAGERRFDGHRGQPRQRRRGRLGWYRGNQWFESQRRHERRLRRGSRDRVGRRRTDGRHDRDRWASRPRHGRGDHPGQRRQDGIWRSRGQRHDLDKHRHVDGRLQRHHADRRHGSLRTELARLGGRPRLGAVVDFPERQRVHHHLQHGCVQRALEQQRRFPGSRWSGVRQCRQEVRPVRHAQGGLRLQEVGEWRRLLVHRDLRVGDQPLRRMGHRK